MLVEADGAYRIVIVCRAEIERRAGAQKYRRWRRRDISIGASFVNTLPKAPSIGALKISIANFVHSISAILDLAAKMLDLTLSCRDVARAIKENYSRRGYARRWPRMAAYNH